MAACHLRSPISPPNGGLKFHRPQRCISQPCGNDDAQITGKPGATFGHLADSWRRPRPHRPSAAPIFG